MTRVATLSAVGAASSYGLGLAGLGELSAQSSVNDYKALVCVFLRGGNDHANTLIPYDAYNYARYSAIRGGNDGVALKREALSGSVLIAPNDQILTDDQVFALSPSMPYLKSRFDTGELAPILNVGPLIAPLTKAQFNSSNIKANPRPSKLFSHNDQQSTWESFQPEGATTGWGGRIGDLALSSNQNAMFTAIGLSGNTVFLNGQNTASFQLSPSGPIKMYGLNSQVFGSSMAGAALHTLLRQQNNHVLGNDYATVNSRSIEYSGFVEDALKNAPSSTQFGGGQGLAGQLSVVARLIASRQNLGVKRQVFLVSVGGFDNHSNLNTAHQSQLAGLDQALQQFYSVLNELGVKNQVTTFTASDFGRTLSSNGNGSDHGWGGHHFVLGGMVRGGMFYGRAPHVSIESDDQVGSGRLLPSSSVDQYACTLAKWFGVGTSDLPYIAPNIGRFASHDLGFMRADN